MNSRVGLWKGYRDNREKQLKENDKFLFRNKRLSIRTNYPRK